MRIIIEAIKLDVTPALKTYIESKLQPLEKFVKKFEEDNNTEIFLEVSRTTKHHHKGPVFRAEANLKIGGTMLHAEANAENVRAAVDLIKDELKQEISHFKGKITAKARRGNRQVG